MKDKVTQTFLRVTELLVETSEIPTSVSGRLR